MSNNYRKRSRSNPKRIKVRRRRKNWARVQYGRTKRQGEHYAFKVRKSVSLWKIVLITLLICFSVVIALLIVNIISVRNSDKNLIENSPESVLSDLEHSFNKGDADGIIECLDPNSQAVIRDSSKVIGVVIDLSDFINIADIVLSYSKYVDGVDVNDFEDPYIKIDINDIKYENDKAIIKAKTRYYYSDEPVNENDDIFYFIRYEGKWYIDGSDLIDKFIRTVK